jgi:metal-sulfur cluster biosynthetic enzyme
MQATEAAVDELATAVLDALGDVRDPELDEAVTALGFVSGVRVANGTAEVRLRLPTYFCAPNFAFLMATDAQRAAEAVPGVRRARVVLEDHFASDEINAGLADGDGFDHVFAGEADGHGLDELRDLFRRKAFLARQQRLCESLLAGGRTAAALTVLTLGDLPTGPETAAYLARRSELGLPTGPREPFVVSPAGEAVRAEAMGDQLRIGRAVRVSLDGNAGLCRSLLATRYELEEQDR